MSGPRSNGSRDRPAAYRDPSAPARGLGAVTAMQYFSKFSFDPVEGRLFRGADEVPLTRKASSLLGCLIDRAGTWVSKDAIMTAVWPDTHVQPDNIKVLVREIRLALGDEPKAPLYIQSAVGRGYSFVSRISDQAEHRGADAVAGSRAPDLRQPRSRARHAGGRTGCGERVGKTARDRVGGARRRQERIVRCLPPRGPGQRARARRVTASASTVTSNPEPYLPLPRRAASPRSPASRPRAGFLARVAPTWLARVPAVARGADAWRASAGDARGADRPARGAVA